MASGKPHIYTATISQRRQDYLIRNTDCNVRTLTVRTTKSLKPDGSSIYDVPELEDETVASKIEVMFADVPVIAKYRKNLVNLKWVHTGANGYIIANERRFLQAKESQQKCEWDRTFYASRRSLFSLSIGILGVGQIGKQLAKMCKEYGMTVWGLTRRKHLPEDSCPYVDFYRTQDGLGDILENCDYICSILPSTPQTRNILSGDVLKSCRNKRRQDYLIRNTDCNVITLTVRTTKPVKPDGFAVYDVPALEDETVASKIEVMFADVPVIAKYRKNLVNLKWAHTGANGVNILMDSFEKNEPFPKFTLTKTPGSLNASHTIEYVTGYIIANERRFLQAKESQQKCEWDRTFYATRRSLFSLAIGILGVGQIGKRLAKMCKEYGMTVWGLTRRQHSPDDSCPYVDFYRTQDGLGDILENCDYICSILPSTPQTRDMLSGDVLKSCRNKKSVFINVGRGDVIDEQSIVTAIKNGWLSGAILDAFHPEPLPASSPLWSLPGVIITPHVSGWSLDPSHTENVMGCFLENLERFVRGQPLKWVLDWSQGY